MFISTWQLRMLSAILIYPKQSKNRGLPVPYQQLIPCVQLRLNDQNLYWSMTSIRSSSLSTPTHLDVTSADKSCKLSWTSYCISLPWSAYLVHRHMIFVNLPLTGTWSSCPNDSFSVLHRIQEWLSNDIQVGQNPWSAWAYPACTWVMQVGSGTQPWRCCLVDLCMN